MKIKSLELAGIVIIIALGTLLHFAYDFFDQNQFIGLIAPVNESIWEHLKMVFYGILIYGAIEILLASGDHKGFLFAKVFSAIIGSLLLIVLYYGYTSFIDHNLYMDIFIFVVAVTFAQLLSLGILSSKFYFRGISYIATIALVLGVMAFSAYTYEAPNNEIFVDTSDHNGSD